MCCFKNYGIAWKLKLNLNKYGLRKKIIYGRKRITNDKRIRIVQNGQ